MLSLLFAWMRWRHRDPGAGWFAAGLAAGFVIFAAGLRPDSGVVTAHRGATVFAALAILGLGWGTVDHIGGAPAWRRRWRARSARRCWRCSWRRRGSRCRERWRTRRRACR
jgi:hypothetical protein